MTRIETHTPMVQHSWYRSKVIVFLIVSIVIVLVNFFVFNFDSSPVVSKGSKLVPFQIRPLIFFKKE